MSALGGINLNGIVSQVLHPLHNIETVLLKRFLSQAIDEEGRTIVVYAEPVEITAQIQTPTDSRQEWKDRLNENSQQKMFWVNTEVKPLDRDAEYGGDVITYDGYDWLVISQPDNFVKQGWVSVIGERMLVNDA